MSTFIRQAGRNNTERKEKRNTQNATSKRAIYNTGQKIPSCSNNYTHSPE